MMIKNSIKNSEFSYVLSIINGINKKLRLCIEMMKNLKLNFYNFDKAIYVYLKSKKKL